MTERPQGVVRIRRLLPASPEEVFAAWTDPESVKQWMCPGEATVPVVELDVCVGGRYRIVMRDKGADYEHTGEYLEVQPPNRLVFTWRSPATAGVETVVTVELQRQGKNTEMVLTHDRLPDVEAERKHTGGWESIAGKLEAHLKK